ncbi:MAG: MurR/RpiR family transcriptional regulator [Silicimonas sp.]|nr:MurR/RpiR family transcriptional regulator [Silicimonas sp.]
MSDGSKARLEARIANRYGDLSGKLRSAADYVVAHPVEIATRSLRSVSAASRVSPATLSRLARALDFESYEEMRELSRSDVGSRVVSFSEKAAELRAKSDAGDTMLDAQAGACMSNIAALTQSTDHATLNRAVATLGNARQVLLFGAFGSNGIVEYLAYLAHFFSPDWSMAARMGSSLSASLETIGEGDAFLVVTKTPYARRAVLATQIARENGARTIVLSDRHTCPALAHADIGFCVPSDSPQFFSSYVATLVLIETLIAMIVAQSKDDISTRIKSVEERNQRLGEFWAD